MLPEFDVEVEKDSMKIILFIALAMVILVLLYLFLIMPRIWGRPDTAAFEGRMYAHRGLHDNAGNAPENSLMAFKNAIDAGYGIELDVQLSRDGIPVVFHDGTLERMCKVKGNVCDYTYEQLKQFPLCESQERIPRFQDVLELVDGRVPLIVEYKGETTDVSVCRIADPLLRKYQGVYCIESFNPLIVAWYRKNRKEVLRGQLAEKLYSKGTKKSVLNFVLEHLLFDFYARPDFIAYNHMHHDNLSRRIVTGLYRNISVAYTIKSQEDFRKATANFDWFIFDSFIPEPFEVPSGKQDVSR